MKENSKQEIIIDRAKEVFDEMGIAASTMHIIADRAGISRRTLYRYFQSKEDVVFHVLMDYMKVWNDVQQDIYGKIEGNGIEKMEALLYALMHFMMDHLYMIKFMAHYDFYFRDASEFSMDVMLDEQLNQSFHVSDSIFYEIVATGQKDGSISLKEDVNVFIPTMTNLLWIFGKDISLRENHLNKEFGISPIEMFKCQLRVYLETLRA
ncbi:MAG: TetR/AcrR family transcriptional regulator [Clostridia bacterium]|nr:TetR/AcrR family transcriptional regulator [Clostridia bacterium]